MCLEKIFPPAQPPLVPGDVLFDAHCHVFNLEYLLLEICQIIHDMAHGSYPGMARAEEGAKSAPGQAAGPMDMAENFLSWLLQIGIAAVESEKSNVAFVREAAKKSWKYKGLSLVPLMMDIYYLYAPPLAAGQRLSDWKAGFATLKASEAAAGDRAGAFERANEHFRRRLRSAAASARDSMKLKAMDLSGAGKMADDVERLAERVIRASAKNAKNAKDGEPGFHHTAGFDHQFEAVKALGKAGSGVYPFFAVDARREGAIDWAIDSGSVGKGGPFYGIKLYPRLGCHPACAEFDRLYEFCRRGSVPMTSHASYKGFPDWMMDWADYGYPGNFRPALDAHPGLKIDLAHFGDRDDDTAWGDEIAAMIAAYPNVYSDLACFTHSGSLQRYQSRYSGMEKVRDRTMFGSDFDVMYFTCPGITLEEYYSSFLNFFGAQDLGRMACQVPKEFLGL
jgi:predicted TIM-barrel fold metal-dependent hydrolase